MRMLGICAWILACVSAGDAPRPRSILVAQYQGPGGNRLIEVSGEGKVVWEHKVPSLCVIFQALPHRHVVYAYGGKPTGVCEIDRDQKIVWNHVSQCPQV